MYVTVVTANRPMIVAIAVHWRCFLIAANRWSMLKGHCNPPVLVIQCSWLVITVNFNRCMIAVNTWLMTVILSIAVIVWTHVVNHIPSSIMVTGNCQSTVVYCNDWPIAATCNDLDMLSIQRINPWKFITINQSIDQLRFTASTPANDDNFQVTEEMKQNIFLTNWLNNKAWQIRAEE